MILFQFQLYHLFQGHFGKVYKVKNRFDRRTYAIKQIPIIAGEHVALQEVENLSKVGRHKNIVNYLDCFLIQYEKGNASDAETADSGETYSSHLSRTSQQSSSFLNFDKDVSNLQIFRGSSSSQAESLAKTKVNLFT